MKLVSAELQGVGRFDAEKINLAGKLIAIVGANEAGKTSLLRGLNHLTSLADLPTGLKARNTVKSDGSTSVSAIYEVENEIGAELLAMLVSPPVKLTINRRENLSLEKRIDPTPAWNLAEVSKATAMLKRAASSKYADELRLAEAPEEGSEPSSEYRAREALRELDAVLAELDTNPRFGDATLKARIDSAEILFSRAAWAKHRARFDVIAEWIRRPDPVNELDKILWNSTPEFAMFGEADRTLQPSYALDEELVTKTPSALVNLLGLAKLDLAALHSAVSSDDSATWSRLLLTANENLQVRFAATWNQAELTVHLDVHGDRLVVLIRESDNEITVLDERSSGLRSFVALIAFVESGRYTPAPILLIDEAEQHLHIDAQAELIDMLEAQVYASKVIYTTHSPACLPTDLGTRVRVVEPEARNSPRSRIRNHFWVQGTPGFSPLMMAMGAGAAAFTPSRRAVIAEGATEMILLPRLIKEAIGQKSLPYQIAPGLSEAPKRVYPELDLEAARVAFLVDGDKAGLAMKKNLLQAGVGEGVVLVSPVAELELFVAVEPFLAAANEAIRAANVGDIESMSVLAETGRWESVAAWCRARALRPPSKIAIASLLGETEELIVEPTQQANLIALDTAFRRVLRSS